MPDRHRSDLGHAGKRADGADRHLPRPGPAAPLTRRHRRRHGDPAGTAPHPGPAARAPARRAARRENPPQARQRRHHRGPLSRPGGAQARLLAEINTEETERNLGLALAEFRNYQRGVMPAGPGARELTALFARIDTAITAPVPGDVKVHNSDRDILNLLSKQAATLHPGIANYCS